jgi:cell division protein FtsB
MKKYKQNVVAWKVFSVSASVGLIIIAVLLSFSSWKILARTFDSIKYRKLTEANLKSLTERQSELESKISELETDSGVEKEIREKFPVAKPGEEVIMIVNNKSGLGQEADPKTDSGFWHRLRGWWDSL